MRIGGMASGMDTDTIIRDLMKANRIPLEKVTQKKSYLEYQLNDYRSINRNLQSSIYKLNDTMLRAGTFTPKTVTSSNPDAVNIKSAGSSADFSGSIAVGQLAAQATWQSTGSNPGKDLNAAIGDIFGTGVTSINITAPGADGATGTTTPVTIEAGDTIESVLAKINASPGVNAFYDSKSGKIAMTAKNSGKGDIVVTETSGDPNVNLGVGQSGKDALYTINGLETSSSSNTFKTNGYEITLKQVTGTEFDHGTPITFSATTDTDKVVESVVQFVNDYNKMIEELNAKISETKYRNFAPLSDEQKKDMKENEIKLWEEKAMSGTLKNDPIISNMLTKLRTSIVSNEVDGLSLRDIGITPSTNYLDNGKLFINEDKLREAITADPEKVANLFSEKAEGANKGGVAVQVRDVMEQGRAMIAERAGSVGAGNSTFTLGRNLDNMNKQITSFENRMKMVEDRLWKQFTAMEQAINRANAQSAQLMSSLGGA